MTTSDDCFRLREPHRGPCEYGVFSVRCGLPAVTDRPRPANRGHLNGTRWQVCQKHADFLDRLRASIREHGSVMDNKRTHTGDKRVSHVLVDDYGEQQCGFAHPHPDHPCGWPTGKAKTKRVATAIRFDPALHEALRETADELSVGINWLVNRLCAEGLESMDLSRFTFTRASNKGPADAAS